MFVAGPSVCLPGFIDPSLIYTTKSINSYRGYVGARGVAKMAVINLTFFLIQNNKKKCFITVGFFLNGLVVEKVRN